MLFNPILELFSRLVDYGVNSDLLHEALRNVKLDTPHTVSNDASCTDCKENRKPELLSNPTQETSSTATSQGKSTMH